MSQIIDYRHKQPLSKYGHRLKHKHQHQQHADLMMCKDLNFIIGKFEEMVNMSARELEEGLETRIQNLSRQHWDIEHGNHVILRSDHLAWHQDGHKVLDILKRNPERDHALYTIDDIQHMRNVIWYLLRHMGKPGMVGNLMTWGHNPAKVVNLT